MSRAPEAGVTLVEMLVALALFALVGLASFTTLDAVIRTRDRTEGRLEAVAALDRALILWSRDLGGSVPQSPAIAEGVLSFESGAGEMSYAVADGALVRRSVALEQRLVEGVAAVGWRAMDRDGAWHEAWPPETGAAPLTGLEMRLTLTGEEPAPSIRRLVELPLGTAP